MKLICLSSSSSGNCYLLNSDTECLVLEAGLPFKEVKKALDFNVGKIVGVVATHMHSDHFGYAAEYLKSGIPVYAPEETHKSLSREYDCQKVVRCGYEYVIGNFKIYPFHAEHDVECFGYVIVHPDMGKLLFCTDSAFVKSSFKNLKVNHIAIEANYSEAIVEDLLSRGLIDQSRVNRVFRTHMSIETCKEFVRANKTASLDSVTLLHLSSGNSNAEQFREEIQEVVGKDVRVAVADKGVEVKLDLFPW
jgi:phosphoribosyl 1,2-cyclic phosphodiesterase